MRTSGGLLAGFEVEFDIGIFHPFFGVTDDAGNHLSIAVEEGDIQDPGLFPDLAGLEAILRYGPKSSGFVITFFQ